MATEIILSRIHPDYLQIRSQLQLVLSGLDTWKDLEPTATGQALIDFAAAIGDLDQYSIEHSYKEAFLDARKTSSVYAIAKLLGVRLTRKAPASATVQFTRATSGTTLSIPAYTAFNGGGTQLFNREPIVMNIGVTTIAATLFEGQIRDLTQLSDGSDFQLFVAEEQQFQISDTDVQVFAGTTPIQVVQNGLWNQKGLTAVQDMTFSNGELLLMFGNDLYGYKPAVNTLLRFRYVVTLGTAGNAANFVGRTVNSSDFTQVTGVATTALTGGADERDANFYRKFGPQLFSASERATTEDEYRALAVRYPSVLDALVVGQRKLSPSNNAFMNLVRVSLLTSSTWGTPQFDEFTRYYEARTIFPTRFYFDPPTALVVNVSANVYCRFEGDLTEVDTAIRASLTSLFAPRAGIIGLNFFKTDVDAAIRNSDPSIEFFELLAPTTDVYPMFKAPRPPVVTELLTGGTLSGPVAYAVTVITPSGETLADNIGTQTLVGPSSRAQLQWTAIPGSLGYNIYGRAFPGAFLVATVGPTVTTYVDNGTPISGAAPPAFDTSGIRYCQLGTVTLNMFYTDRRIS